MVGGGINDAEMHAAQQKIAAERRRIRNFTYVKEIGQDWVGTLSETDETPPLDQVDGVYLILGYKDRMVVVRADGESKFRIPRLLVDEAARDTSARGGAAAQLNRWLKPVCRGQWGIHLKEWTQHTRFELEPTPENTTAPPDSRRYELFLYGSATKLDDLPEGSAWSRRTVTRKDFIQLIQAGYTEFEETVRDVHEAYVIARERAVASGSRS
jgi:hypothetical protein